jgi:GTP-binding protein EngB required for normal cell division
MNEPKEEKEHKEADVPSFSSFLCLLNKLDNQFGGELKVPTVLLCGGQNAGKSALGEGLVQVPFNFTAHGFGTRVPLRFQTFADANCHEPIWTIEWNPPGYNPVLRKDLTTEQAQAQVCDINTLLGEAEDVSRVEIVATMRYCNTSNFTFIDLPGYQANPLESQRAQGDAIQAINTEYIEKHLPRKESIIVVAEKFEVDYENRSFLRYWKDQGFHSVNQKAKLVLALTQFDAKRDDSNFCRDQEEKLQPMQEIGFSGVFLTSCPPCNGDDFIKHLNRESHADAQALDEIGNHRVCDQATVAGVTKLREFLTESLISLALDRGAHQTRLGALKRAIDKSSKDLIELQSSAQQEFQPFVHKFVASFASNFLNIKNDTLNESAAPKNVRTIISESRQNLEEEYKDDNCRRGATYMNPEGHLAAAVFPYRQERSFAKNQHHTRDELMSVVSGEANKFLGSSQLRRLLEEFAVALYSGPADNNSEKKDEADLLTEMLNQRTKIDAAGTFNDSGKGWESFAEYVLHEKYSDRTCTINVRVFAALCGAILKSWVGVTNKLTRAAWVSKVLAVCLPFDVSRHLQLTDELKDRAANGLGHAGEAHPRLHRRARQRLSGAHGGVRQGSHPAMSPAGPDC